jgi:hypothetical protein
MQFMLTHAAKLESQAQGITGQLTPEFCEWLMGYPIGFSELNASETQSFHKSLKSSRKPSTQKSQNETRQTSA